MVVTIPWAYGDSLFPHPCFKEKTFRILCQDHCSIFLRTTGLVWSRLALILGSTTWCLECRCFALNSEHEPIKGNLLLGGRLVQPDRDRGVVSQWLQLCKREIFNKELPRNTEWGHSPHIFNIHLSAEVLEFLSAGRVAFQSNFTPSYLLLKHLNSRQVILKIIWSQTFTGSAWSGSNLESYFLRGLGKKEGKNGHWLKSECG